MAVEPASGGATSVPIRGSAAALVRHMEASLSVPTATTMRTFSVAGLDRALAESARRGHRVSSSRILAYAVAQAATRVPTITHRLDSTGSTPARAVDGAVHLGIAVDVPRQDGT